MPKAKKGKANDAKGGKSKGGAKKEKPKEVRPPFVNKTPEGKLKDFKTEMAGSYHPQEVEAAWNAWWDKEDLYKPEDDSTKETFMIVLPPPNVTGTLHLGHALTCAVQDAVVRWNRMSGKNTLWVPGTDHAGIATQVVVEKKMMRERKQTRHDLGRENFLKEVWKWKEQSGAHICKQLRMLGASVDWSREVFTMDDKCSAAVQEAFVRMHENKVIYRANRLVTWSCSLKTAISSIEVEYRDIDVPTMLPVPNYDEKVEFGVIHSFAYKFKEAKFKDEEIVVATTRLETMLGDVAVAVHPEDPRYKKYHGAKLVHPFVKDRDIVVVTDDVLVDMAFGTGAVKITPAHDPNDFECGLRHKLPQINVLDDDGNMNEHGGVYAGQKRFHVRAKLIDDMTKMGIYRGKAPNKMNIGFCSRSKDVVEPVIRPQWWVDCNEMAASAVQKVRSGELKIEPESYKATWYRWLENIKDWCISRQLWWGHRIPAYFVTIKGKPAGAQHDDNYWVVARSKDVALEEAAKRFNVKKSAITLEQDPDVLDTWFSSGLFPFSVLGWPNQTADLSTFYPGNLLETGGDILFFWVARMVMMALHLTDKLPFNTVYLHSMVRDKFGRKMSKSLGNVVDPLDVISGVELSTLHDKLRNGNLDPKEVMKAIEGQTRDFPDGIAECGSDALRYGLLAYCSQARDINLDIQRVVSYRQFCNKLWNATKFALTNFGEGWKRPTNLDATVAKDGSTADRWILHRLAFCIEKTNQAFADYSFAEATTFTYNFWLYDLCDYYLELIKPVVKGDQEGPKDAALAVLFTCLEFGLRLLHPLMPFVTEELFHRLPGHVEHYAAIKKAQPKSRKGCGSIMVQDYPSTAASRRWVSKQAEQDIDLMKEIVQKTRSARASLGLQRKKCDLFVVCEASLVPTVTTLATNVGTLALSEKVEVHEAKAFAVPEGCVSVAVGKDIMVYLPVAKLVDLVKESLKITKQREKLSTVTETLREKTRGSNYADKTPVATQAEHKEKLANQDGQIDKLDASIAQLVAVMAASQKDEFMNTLLADAEKELATATASLNKQIVKCKGKEPAKKVLASIEAAEVSMAAAFLKVTRATRRMGKEVSTSSSSSSGSKESKSDKAPAAAGYCSNDTCYESASCPLHK